MTDSEPCQWCGPEVVHDAMCPRVSAIRYHGSGGVAAVEFIEQDATAVVDFLDGIDPEILDTGIQQELDGVDPGTFPELALRVLRRMAGGD